MPYNTEKAGTSLPVERPDVDAILSAIAHLQLAAEYLDAQRAKGLGHLPKEKREKMYDSIDESVREVWEQYDNCCVFLFEILRPQDTTLNPSAL